MSKLTLTDITSGYALTTTVNANNALIEAALENTLSRDGTGPNTMSAPLDMNSQRITNLPTAVNSSEPVTLGQAASIAGVTTPLTQAAVGAVLFPQSSGEASAGVTPTNYYYEPGNVLRYGATGDGATEDTAAIQAAIDSMEADQGQVRIPKGTYMIDSTTGTKQSDPYGLLVDSRVEIYFEPGAILKSTTQSAANYAVLMVSGDDILIHGKGKILGERDSHTGSTGEFGHCLDIRNSDNVTVRDLELNDAWGDGIYVGGHVTSPEACNDIVIDGVYSWGNRRNNMSVVYVNEMSISNSIFEGATGTAPEAGLDIEPNAGQSALNINVSNCIAVGNGGIGFQTYGAAGGVRRVSFNGCTARSNTTRGFYLGYSDWCTISGCNTAENTTEGIELEQTDDCSITGNTCVANNYGIFVLTSNNNTITGNVVNQNGKHGIFIDNVSGNNTVVGNTVFDNSQDTDVTYDNINIDRNSDRNSVVGNNIHEGALTNQPRYGINVVVSTCDNTLISGNQLTNGGQTANINDAGTGTKVVNNLGVNDFATMTADDVTPSVKNLRTLTSTANTGATAITQLDDGVEGQIVTLHCGSSTNAPTIADSGNFSLSAAWAPDLHDTLTLVYVGSVWKEIARSAN